MDPSTVWTFIVLSVRVGLLPIAAPIPPKTEQGLRQACRWLAARKRSLKFFDVHRGVDTFSGGVPFWDKGFAWDSLLGGIPPMFSKEYASLLQCSGCESTENRSAELIDKVGDAKRPPCEWSVAYSNSASYFIDEYSVKVTWLSIVILG